LGQKSVLYGNKLHLTNSFSPLNQYAMSILRFFRPPLHQRYQYKPRFWDPDKDELKERLEQATGEKKGDTDAMKSRIAGHFARRYTKSSMSGEYRLKQERSSNLRLILILAVIILLAYFVLTAPNVLQYFE
jgi:hypothetical protein